MTFISLEAFLDHSLAYHYLVVYTREALTLLRHSSPSSIAVSSPSGAYLVSEQS